MVMKDLIKNILHQYITESKQDMGWRNVQTKTTDRLKTHTSVFFTKKFKYIVEVEEYDNHFYLVSFYPKLNKDWYDKQLTRKMFGQDYKDKYSYRTNENIPMKILGVLVEHIRDILNKDPYASFGYFGAPDEKTDRDEDIINTQRFRVYNPMMVREFGKTHKLVAKTEYSGALLINKEVEKEFPEIVDYGLDILQTHL
jgi:hypothetical protein